MSMKKSSKNLIDPNTLILKKYFSFVGKRNHSTDIFHDKANLFPEFSAFQKPCCKISHYDHEDCEFPDPEEVREITKGYVLPPLNLANAKLQKAKSILVPTLKELRAREKLQQEARMKDNEEKKRIKESQERERKIKRGYIEESRLFNKDTSFSNKNPRNKALLAGKRILEKSNRLLMELKSPNELFDQMNALEKKAQSDLENRKKDKEEKEKLKKLIKRLDVTLRSEEPDDVRKALNILQKVPVEYYQKARELKQKQEEKSTSRRARNPVRPLHIDTRAGISGHAISNTNRNASITLDHSHLPIIKNLTRGYSQESDMSSRRSRMMRGLEVTKREEKLFFSPLHKYISSHKKKKLNSADKSFSLYIDRLNKTVDDESPQKTDTSAWIDKISEIKDNINSCLTKIPTQIKFVNQCAEILENDVKKWENTQPKDEDEEFDEQFFKEDYEKEEQEEIIFNAKNRGVEVYNILKTALGIGSGDSINQEGSKENTEFYKRIALKERRKADKLIASHKR